MLSQSTLVYELCKLQEIIIVMRVVHESFQIIWTSLQITQTIAWIALNTIFLVLKSF